MENSFIGREERDVKIIREIGDAIGFGNLMEYASALWRYDLKHSGSDPNAALVTYSKITNSTCDDSVEIYDQIVEIFDGGN